MAFGRGALFTPFDIFEGEVACFENVFSVLKQISGFHSLRIIKSWLNDA